MPGKNERRNQETRNLTINSSSRNYQLLSVHRDGGKWTKDGYVYRLERKRSVRGSPSSCSCILIPFRIFNEEITFPIKASAFLIVPGKTAEKINVMSIGRVIEFFILGSRKISMSCRL